MKKGYSAYNLTSKGREMLLKHFSPKFSKVVAHHATFQFGVNENAPIPSAQEIEVIGYASNEDIECVVVKVNGTHIRPDGKIFHITLSHSSNARPVDSNDLCAKGWDTISAFTLPVEPKFNSFG